jgi:hypothetical protein
VVTVLAEGIQRFSPQPQDLLKIRPVPPRIH